MDTLVPVYLPSPQSQMRNSVLFTKTEIKSKKRSSLKKKRRTKSPLRTKTPSHLPVKDCVTSTKVYLQDILDFLGTISQYIKD